MDDATDDLQVSVVLIFSVLGVIRESNTKGGPEVLTR